VSIRRTPLAVAVFSLLCAQVLCQPAADPQEQAAKAALASGKLDEAVDACRAWIKQEPEATKPHFLLSEVLVRLKLYDRAREELETVLDLNPALAIGHVRLGDLFRLQGDLAGAEQSYQRAIEVSDKCVEAYVGLAHCALEAGKPGDAGPPVDAALRIAPDNAAALAVAGQVAYQSGDITEADARFRQALEKDPQCADALYSLAALLQADRPAGEAEAQQLWDRFLQAEQGTDRAWQVKQGLVPLDTEEVPSAPGRDERLDVSADGEWVVTAVLTDPGSSRSGELWVAPVDGSAPPRQITVGPGANNPRWSGDGTRVYFDFHYDESGKTQVYSVPADGSAEPANLTQDLPLARIVGPLPGTDRLVYTDAWRFWTMKPDGSDKQQLPTKNAGNVEIAYPRLSADGKAVAYQSVDWNDKRPGGPLRNIAVAPLDGSTAPRCVSPEYAGDALRGSVVPAWAPDGIRLAYVSDIWTPQQSFSLCAQVVGDAHPPVVLTRGVITSVWLPDGTGIIYTDWRPHDPGAIFVLHLGGKRLPPVRP
jgi:tetratricopeptide (TPR) repeat protein